LPLALHELRNRGTRALGKKSKSFHYQKMSIETPCIAVCIMDPRTNLCFGCGRTLPEIARWHRMEGAERRAIIAQLPARMAQAGLASPKAATPSTLD